VGKATMRLEEIIDASHLDLEYDEEAISRELASLQDSVDVMRISNTLSIGSKNRTFVFKKHSEVVGFLKLGETISLFDKTYDTIKLIYLIPSIRKTVAAGAFLIGVKKLLDKPLILGSDKFGGVIYKQGISLVHSLNSPARSSISVLDLRTGEKYELGNSIPFRPSHMTLVFEDCEVPLLCNETKQFDGLRFYYNGIPTIYLFEGAEDRQLATEDEL
jgi:hypothetical protein